MLLSIAGQSRRKEYQTPSQLFETPPHGTNQKFRYICMSIQLQWKDGQSFSLLG